MNNFQPMEKNDDVSSLVISENLFATIDLLTQNALSKAQFDKTYICKIIDVKKFQDNYYKYSIRYEEGNRTFIVYDTKEYSKDSNVIVKVINGDWNITPIIEGNYNDRSQIKTVLIDYNNNFIKRNNQSLGNEIISFKNLKEKQIYIKKDNSYPDEVYNYFGFEFLINSNSIKKENSFEIIIYLFLEQNITKDNYKQDTYYVRDKNALEFSLFEDTDEYYDTDYEYYTLTKFVFKSEDIIGNIKTDDSFFPFSVLFNNENNLNQNFYIALTGIEYNENKQKIENSEIKIDLSKSNIAIGFIKEQEEKKS